MKRLIFAVIMLTLLAQLAWAEGQSNHPLQVLSPVEGDIEQIGPSSSCSDPTKWCFYQHQTGDVIGHIPGGGICHADDTYAWDANLNTPAWDSDQGRPVYAVAQGVVCQTYGGCKNADDDGKYGQVLIEHTHQGNMWWSGYLHLSNIQVTKGQAVTENTIVGYVSYEGVYPPNNHLHFVVYTGENKDSKLKSFDAKILPRSGSSTARIDNLDVPAVDVLSIGDPDGSQSTPQVTLTLYVHAGSASGPIIQGAQVSGQDALGSSFYQTTDSSGFVIVKGSPGTWQFTVTKPGYDFNSWSQEITETCTKHAFLFLEETAVEARDDLSTNNDMSDLEIGESSEVNLLIEALMDRDGTVRLNAAQSLGEMGNAEAVDPLIYALGDDEWEVRRKAAWALGEIGDPRAIEPLSYLSVKDSDSDVRNEAKDALKKRVFGDTGDARDVYSIIVALTDRDSNIRLRAAQALGEMGNAEAVDPLIDALGDDEWQVRRKAAWALGEIGDPRAIEPLSYLSVKDLDSDVRNEAKDALKKRVFGDTGDARDVYSIIVALTDRDSNVRLRAAQALGEMGNAEAVDPLIDALGDDEWQVRRKAAWALGEIGDPRAIEPLSYLSVKDLDSDVRNEAKDALKKSVFGDTGDARDVYSITVALKDEDSNVRLRAAQALGEMGNAEAVDPLIGALKDDEWQVRRKAAWALGEIGDTRAVNPIIEALKDSDGDVRNEAKTALEKLGWQG